MSSFWAGRRWQTGPTSKTTSSRWMFGSSWPTARSWGIAPLTTAAATPAWVTPAPATRSRTTRPDKSGCRDARTVRRVVTSLASYVLRWQRRPTPFGLFAGVGVARIGDGAKVRWGGEHRVAARADADWLGDVLTRLHQCLELLERLSVVVNNAATVRGDRFV